MSAGEVVEQPGGGVGGPGQPLDPDPNTGLAEVEVGEEVAEQRHRGTEVDGARDDGDGAVEPEPADGLAAGVDRPDRLGHLDQAQGAGEVVPGDPGGAPEAEL